MSRRSSTLLCIAAAILCGCSSPASTGLRTLPIGPEPAGKGGAGSTRSQDSTATFEEIIWAQEDPLGDTIPWPLGDDNELSFGFGGAFWPGLSGLDPDTSFPTGSGFGRLQNWGFGLDLGYHHRVAEARGSSLWLGGRFGLQNWEERQSFFVRLPNGEVVDDNVSATVIQFTLSARVEQDLGPYSAFIGFGGGYYELSIDEEEDYYWEETDTLADNSSFGGFVSLGMDFDISPFTAVRIENLTHFVHFDDLDEFTPGEDSISGPFNVIQLAIVGRF